MILEVLAGKERELEEAFRTAFVPAIRVQEGFRRVAMLKMQNALRRYQIELAFDSEELRLQWVASREHQEAFPKLAALCRDITWSGFQVVHQQLGSG